MPNFPPASEIQEPLQNIDLESAAVGLRMALTPEEAQEARGKFLETLRVSTLAVPTIKPVETDENGALVPGAEISLLVVNTPDGQSGVPAFTTLTGLRAALQGVENGMFLSGADLGNILGPSPHTLFVDGPDIHVEVPTAELQQMAFITNQIAQVQQQVAGGNETLDAALHALAASDTPETRETVLQAFVNGFCLYPVAGEEDADADAVTLSQEGANGGGPEPALLLQDDALLCFTSTQALEAWNPAPRAIIPLPGQMIVPLATQADVAQIVINIGSPGAQTLRIAQEQVSVA